MTCTHSYDHYCRIWLFYDHYMTTQPYDPYNRILPLQLTMYTNSYNFHSFRWPIPMTITFGYDHPSPWPFHFDMTINLDDFHSWIWPIPMTITFGYDHPSPWPFHFDMTINLDDFYSWIWPNGGRMEPTNIGQRDSLRTGLSKLKHRHHF